MNEAVERGARILVCDSVSMEDMETIVDALIAAKLKFIPVDPGVFTATAAKRVLPRKKVTGPGKVLMVIGSVNGVARRQVKELLAELEIAHVLLDVAEILESEERRRSTNTSRLSAPASTRPNSSPSGPTWKNTAAPWRSSAASSGTLLPRRR